MLTCQVLDLQKEIGRLWAEAQLELRLLSTLTALRLLAHAMYTCGTGFLVFAALSEEVCACSTMTWHAR